MSDDQLDAEEEKKKIKRVKMIMTSSIRKIYQRKIHKLIKVGFYNLFTLSSFLFSFRNYKLKDPKTKMKKGHLNKKEKEMAKLKRET